MSFWGGRGEGGRHFKKREGGGVEKQGENIHGEARGRVRRRQKRGLRMRGRWPSEKGGRGASEGWKGGEREGERE